MTNTLDFVFSDSVMGTVTDVGAQDRALQVHTADGRSFQLVIEDDTAVELLRNLDEPYADAGPGSLEMLEPGTLIFAYGIYYPDKSQMLFAAKHITIFGRRGDSFRFEEPDWWVKQLSAIAGFYRRAQFTGEAIDFTEYRTEIRLGGHKTTSHVQETDTISRLVYGMATAFMLTGQDEFLAVAEAGTEYLREHMRFVDIEDDVVYWYHGIKLDGPHEFKLFTSEFDDDYDAVPMYEQIYALAGPVQTYRVTGDPRIAADTDATLRLFERFFRDPERGGYFSHVDPVTMRPDAESLGSNAGRKNWNSIGDHAPAYLINYYLATGDERHLSMLRETFDLVVEHFCNRSDSPFVQERFHADWTPDEVHSWQQNRAVVGHNLKIAWNLSRLNNVLAKPEYDKTAVHIGQTMPAVGADLTRGGWYDVVERIADPASGHHRFAWHDRKAWWQQEQAILAYLILAGRHGSDEFRAEARAAEAFYNTNFLDHDEGGVYFNVLANGLPYLLGTERLKGSHSMSMYHTSELCFLAAVYNNLLLHNQPLDLWFRPRPADLPGRILRVAPDLLPAGRVVISAVSIDGEPHSDFDAEAMSVRLPTGTDPVKVKVRLQARDEGAP